MFGIVNYAGFVAAIVVFQIIPGPGTVAILNATARHGVRCGMEAVLGTITGDFLFMLAAVLGLATLLASHPAVLASLQWLGIGYLCWLGVRFLWRHHDRNAGNLPSEPQRPVYFRQALAVSSTNPKVIMFFMAFFPLFLRTGSGFLTLLAMMAHVTLISLLYQTGLVLVGNAVALRLSRIESARVVARRLVGLALIGFGVKLALNKR